MGVVEPTNLSVKSFKGLHLYHSGISNCAMRVRITLEEKGLGWTSHHLNLLEGEHLTPEYFGINPNGVVPTLVHNGVVIIESQDIIDYLDRTFPDPPLRPKSRADVEIMHDWMRRSSDIHVKAVKTYIYDKKIRYSMRKTEAEQERYRTLQKNEELLEFHKKSSENSFSKAELDRAERMLDDCFADADQVLSQNEWLAGERFSLADIAWIPLEFTLRELANYHFERFSHVSRWATQIRSKESFATAVLKWWPMPMSAKTQETVG